MTRTCTSAFKARRRWLTLATLGLALSAGASTPLPRPSPGESEPLPAALQKSVPSSTADLRTIERHVEALVQRVSPAVVSVVVRSRAGFYNAGSAVVISKDGLVLCAAHVCSSPNRQVTFRFPDGRTARGETLGTNHEMDAGLMKILDPGPWPFVDVSSTEGHHAGDWVLALGHPGGFDPERPVVVRLGRIIRLGRFLQTDCTLISGDSGGPLFDMQGRVMGIHSRISESPAENFHVPVSAFYDSWERLAAGETWGRIRRRPWSTFGVHAVDDPSGCKLESVSAGGPASAAGLKAGDVILSVNQITITDTASLVACVRGLDPETRAAVRVNRGGQELLFLVTVGRRSVGAKGRP